MVDLCTAAHFHVVPDLLSILEILSKDTNEIKTIKKYIDADCLILEQSANIYYELDNYIEYLVRNKNVNRNKIDRKYYIEQINSIVRVNSFSESFNDEVNNLYGLLNENGISYKDIYNFVLAKHSGADVLLSKNSNYIKMIISSIFPEEDIEIQIHSISSLCDYISNSSFSIKTISVYTRDGDKKDLPINSTAIDLAYKIHTNLGHQSIEAIINGNRGDLSTILKDGDKVEIVKGEILNPKKEWLSFARTNLVKKNIENWYRNKAIRKAKSDLENEFGKNFFYGGRFKYIANRLNKSDISKFLEAFGSGEIGIDEIESLSLDYANRIIPVHKTDDFQFSKKPEIKLNQDEIKESDIKFILSKCCLPLPNAEIFGVLPQKDSNIIKIHKTSCIHAKSIPPKKQRQASWRINQCLLIVELIVKDRENILGFLISQLSEYDIRFNIRSVNPISNDVDINKRTSKLVIHFIISSVKNLDLVRENIKFISKDIKSVRISKMIPGIRYFGLDDQIS